MDEDRALVRVYFPLGTCVLQFHVDHKNGGDLCSPPQAELLWRYRIIFCVSLIHSHIYAELYYSVILFSDLTKLFERISLAQVPYLQKRRCNFSGQHASVSCRSWLVANAGENEMLSAFEKPMLLSGRNRTDNCILGSPAQQMATNQRARSVSPK